LNRLGVEQRWWLVAVRLRDVAELAGVSVKTASNVVNNNPHVKPSTRARVEEAIRQLRYRPNESARHLKYGRSGFLALAVPQLNAPYFAELAGRMSAEAARLGYILMLDVTGADPRAERAVLDGVRSHVIDGLIFSPLALSAEEIAARADDLPMVLLGERAVPKGYDHVAVDSVAAAAAMTNHLIQLGRHRIAAIGRQSFRGTSSVRLRGYKQALAEAGLAYDSRLIKNVANYERSDGKAAMAELLALDKPPDAVLCFNDLMAIGALRACVDDGVDIPGDVAIAGFDNIAEGQFSTPTLTTVAADMDVLSREAIRLLLSRVEGAAESTETLTVPWRLELRESTLGRSPSGAPIAGPDWTDPSGERLQAHVQEDEDMRNGSLPTNVTAKFFKGPLNGQTRRLDEAWEMVRYNDFAATGSTRGDVEEFLPIRTRRLGDENLGIHAASEPLAPVAYERCEWEPGFEEPGVIPYRLRQSR